ncbi:hypothetical protein GCM10028806_60400 [Spirosoma terrae]|uniref:DUF4595 domain-containing protein n=1 Tax=Spirosoma terrae TaxID=1968276 RepID=A0A6L9LF99_9BACT|nr:hypothetical protein [Spirosoma terrae]NDU99164.1 hypothetical protein [Spirosoma terrae]
MPDFILRLGVIMAMLAGLLVSCQSGEPTPKEPRYRVIKAAQTAFNLEVTMTYQYDSLGRLKFVNEYPSVDDNFSAGTPTAQTTVYYSNTKPLQIDHVERKLGVPTTDSDGKVAGSKRVYNYDDQGRLTYISESKALDDFKTLKFSQAFQYDYGTDKLPTTLIVSGPPPLLERNIYSYTFIDGNAVHIKLSSTTARTTKPVVSESDVQFDTAPGVYTNFFAIYPGITSFNKNNVINTNTTMVNDERGLLVKRVKKGNYIDEVTIYTYETY